MVKQKKYKNVFLEAVKKWEQVITGPSLNLSVCVNIRKTDGEDRILGKVGPVEFKTIDNKRFPIKGLMELDVQDVECMLKKGILPDVIHHEFGHVLGIGTNWSFLITGAETGNTIFIGKNACEAYGRMLERKGCPVPVPVENNGGSCTFTGHFREAVFDRELMTKYVDTRMPLSYLTLAVLKDLGFEVNIDKAERFTLPSFVPANRSEKGLLCRMHLPRIEDRNED